VSFFIRHVYRGDEKDPPLERLEQLYDERDDGDAEHFGVSVIHETEWCLTLHPANTLIWENLETGDSPRHMKNVPRDKVLELWRDLARGDISRIDTEPWLKGYY
jgi:hypothetical protein